MDVSKILKSPINLKLVLFYHENPSIVDTAQSIAKWIEQDISKVEKVLEKLVKEKILIAHRSPHMVGYGYTQNGEVIRAIDGYLKKRKKKVENLTAE